MKTFSEWNGRGTGMISDQFDTLSRALRPETRRGALRMLAGAPLAGVLAARLSAPEPARARKRGRKHHKKRQDTASRDCPDCTCPPDPRLAAIDACRARQGLA